MKGIPIFRLKRLKRTALLLGAGTLVAGASLLGAAQANAAVGTQPGALVIAPTSGPTTTAMTYSTTTACPTGNQGSAVVRIISPTTGATTNMSVVNNSVATPFSGSLNATFAQAAAVFPEINGATSELAVYCFPSASAVGTPVAVQDTFVVIPTGGATYTITNTGPPTATTTTLTASPNPATAGQTVTLTATVAPAAATGSVQFSVGGTAIGTPVTVSGGVATTTTTFAAAGTEALAAAYTPTGNFSASSGTLSLTVNAAPPNTGTIPLATTVAASGTFTLTVNTTTVVTVPPDGTTAPTTPIVVTDTRNTFPGWSVTGQDSNWTGSGTAAGASFSGNQLGWVPTNTGTLPQGVTLGPTVPAGTSPGLGSAPQVLASVHAGTGNGFTGAAGATFGANLSLLIPAGQAAGPYTSGLTITAASTNP
jgi:hypothetical protein